MEQPRTVEYRVQNRYRASQESGVGSVHKSYAIDVPYHSFIYLLVFNLQVSNYAFNHSLFYTFIYSSVSLFIHPSIHPYFSFSTHLSLFSLPFFYQSTNLLIHFTCNSFFK